MERWYRVQPAQRDPAELLDPSSHVSEPWGTGEIDADSRDGVSVFPDENSLYRYLVEVDAELEDCVLVVLEGQESTDEDFDSEDGAVLVHPTRICEVRPLDRDRVAAARRDLGA